MTPPTAEAVGSLAAFMAFYDFRCEECGEKFETEQAMLDKHEAPCPKCGGETERIFTSFPGLINNFRWTGSILRGVPRSRMEQTDHLRDERNNRKKDPQSELDEVSSELHPGHRAAERKAKARA